MTTSTKRIQNKRDKNKEKEKKKRISRTNFHSFLNETKYVADAQELPFNRGTCDLRTWHATKRERMRPNSGDDVTRWPALPKIGRKSRSKARPIVPGRVFSLSRVISLFIDGEGEQQVPQVLFSFTARERRKPFRLEAKAFVSCDLLDRND